MEETLIQILSELKNMRIDINELKKGQQKLESGQRLLEVGQQKLEAGQKVLEVGQQNLEAGQRLLKVGQQKFEVGHKVLEVSQQNFEAGQKVLEAGLDHSFNPEYINLSKNSRRRLANHKKDE